MTLLLRPGSFYRVARAAKKDTTCFTQFFNFVATNLIDLFLALMHALSKAGEANSAYLGRSGF